MVFSTVSDRPLSSSVSNANLISSSDFSTGVLTDPVQSQNALIGSSSASALSVSSGVRITTNDFIGPSDQDDYYRFDLSENGNAIAHWPNLI